ncbi:hypothetical protein GE09DRAFT_255508 [Coniochaeta sp. 2T2.1]|nr:hypothetical protein GE09DRAFT_255508 [Coniochaeta sp. 2T2.1]
MPMLREHPEETENARPVPITFQDALKQEASTDMCLTRKLSEESIRTELCDGPVPDSPPRLRTSEQDLVTCSDRAELIERLKRGESPTWVPNRHLESLFQQTDPRSPTRSPRPRSSGSATLLPPLTITPEKSNTAETDEQVEERLQDGLNIERPRSALHSGDFRHHESIQDTPAREPSLRDVANGDQSSSQAWLATSPPRAFALDFERRQPVSYRQEAFASTPSSSLASSLSQSFAYMPPTSPLVQSESNDDLVDISLPMNNIDIAAGGSHTNSSSRRHTLHFYPSSPYSHSALSRHLTPSREHSHPYQAHQPRRSLTSTPNFNVPGSAPQTPGHTYLSSRRQSISSDASPMLHASMVGSYEESILRGRMSTTPSKPLDFQAEIGVLGLGKCKPSLKCPAHVTVPFSAVFYNYTSTTYGRTVSEDGPSPYVGQIDLENGLSNPEGEQRSKRKMAARYPDRRSQNEEDEMNMQQPGLADKSEVSARQRPTRHNRRSRSPKSPPGGSYRIPEKGMLQIIIKNQNKTAVKLFLVRYDLAGMEPGTKTFVRQRSYSDPEDTSSSSTRPILRYLIQLHICCLARGRYYLYKSIRVVFANRVPDGKEKLRQEVTYPEPRFSPYKPTRVMLPATMSGQHTTGGGGDGLGAMLVAEKAWRRRSSGFSSFGARQQMDALDGMGGEAAASSPLSVLTTGRYVSPGTGTGMGIGMGMGGNRTVDPIPLSLPGVKRVTSNATSSTSDETRDSRLQDSLVLMAVEAAGSDEAGVAPPASYGKLSKGDVGYGGNAFATATSAAMEGLLAKSLRSLGVSREEEEEEEES